VPCAPRIKVCIELFGADPRFAVVCAKHFTMQRYRRPNLIQIPDRTDAHATEVGSLFVRVAALDRLNDTPSQVFRVRLPHSCWPPVQWEA
jgi:hypothetical protein